MHHTRGDSLAQENLTRSTVRMHSDAYIDRLNTRFYKLTKSRVGLVAT